MEDQLNPVRSEILSEREIRRYTEQINTNSIGLSGQEKIKQAKVLVIGAGGKGSAVLQNLATVGLGTLGICDNYLVSEDQLSRQHLYGSGDLGKQKAITSRQKLQQINQLVEYQLHNVCLSEENIDGICSPYDILIDATDNFSTHYMISDTAIKLNKPLIFGTVYHLLGFISLFNYKGGPSLRCYYPNPPVPDKKLLSDKGFACQAIVISIVGAVMANETLKLILGINTDLNGNMMIFDATDYQFRLLAIEKNPENFK